MIKVANEKIEPSLVKKRINFNLSGVSTLFDSSQALFSSVDIDIGTQALLNSLRKNKNLQYDQILDLGCGYGVIGIFLKKQDLSRQVVLSDRDMLAVAFSQHNADLNQVAVRVVHGLDYEALSLEDKFSLIVTNFPAKMERQGLLGFIAGASKHLLPNGTLALVIVNELVPDFESVLNELGSQVAVSFQEHKKGHTNYHLQFQAKINLTMHYERSHLILPLESKLELETARGLPEFDTLSFGSEVAMQLLKSLGGKKIKNVVALESGQGSVIVATSTLLKAVQKVALYSRDAMALKFSQLNLSRYFKGQLECYPTAYLKESLEADLILWQVRDKNQSVLHKHNAKFISQSQALKLIYGEEHLIENLLLQYKIAVRDKRSLNGYCAVLV